MNICEDVADIDENVLFAGIVDKDCRIVECKSSRNMVPAELVMPEQQRFIQDKFHHLLVREFNTKLRSFSFVAIHKDCYLEMVFPLSNCILCVVCNPDVSDNALSARVLELIARYNVVESDDLTNRLDLRNCHAV
jgi:hypothetical protein